MKTIIAGTRFVRGPKAESLVADALQESGWITEITELVHGDAPGIDKAAGKYCAGLWPIKVFPADWDAHGYAAGPIRNRQMAEYANALIAIWDGKSKGTKNMIDAATRKGLKVFIKRIDEAPQNIQMNETIVWNDAATTKPDSDITVLVAVPSPGEPIWVGYYDDEQEEWMSPDGVPFSYEVTHWAELPKGPQS